MKMRRFLGLLILVIILAACGGGTHAAPDVDREGYPITIPAGINTIVSIGPSATEIIAELGFVDQIVSTDFFSGNVPGISPDIAVLNMMALDSEFLINLQPDIIFIDGITRVHGDDHPLALVSAADITVIYLPTSASIDDIMEDIRFVAAVLGAHEAGENIIADMQAEMDAISRIAATISQRRTVYFEVSPAPWTWTTGGASFLHEMIELVGAVNVFADHDVDFMSVSDEVLLLMNPDVILTSTDFLDDPIGDIKSRPGFETMTAVIDGRVIQIDTDSSSRASHNITKALWEMARAIYPEYFQ